MLVFDYKQMARIGPCLPCTYAHVPVHVPDFDSRQVAIGDKFIGVPWVSSQVTSRAHRYNGHKVFCIHTCTATALATGALQDGVFWWPLEAVYLIMSDEIRVCDTFVYTSKHGLDHEIYVCTNIRANELIVVCNIGAFPANMCTRVVKLAPSKGE